MLDGIVCKRDKSIADRQWQADAFARIRNHEKDYADSDNSLPVAGKGKYGYHIVQTIMTHAVKSVANWIVNRRCVTGKH